MADDSFDIDFDMIAPEIRIHTLKEELKLVKRAYVETHDRLMQVDREPKRAHSLLPATLTPRQLYDTYMSSFSYDYVPFDKLSPKGQEPWLNVTEVALGARKPVDPLPEYHKASPLVCKSCGIGICIPHIPECRIDGHFTTKTCRIECLLQGWSAYANARTRMLDYVDSLSDGGLDGASVKAQLNELSSLDGPLSYLLKLKGVSTLGGCTSGCTYPFMDALKESYKRITGRDEMPEHDWKTRGGRLS